MRIEAFKDSKMYHTTQPNGFSHGTGHGIGHGNGNGVPQSNGTTKHLGLLPQPQGLKQESKIIIQPNPILSQDQLAKLKQAIGTIRKTGRCSEFHNVTFTWPSHQEIYQMPTTRSYDLKSLEVQENFFNITGLSLHLSNGHKSPIFKGRQLCHDMSKLYHLDESLQTQVIIQKTKGAELSSLEFLSRDYETVVRTKNVPGSVGCQQHVEHVIGEERVLGFYGC